MISFLQGRIVHLETDSLVLETGGVGYEVMLPAIEARVLANRIAAGASRPSHEGSNPYWYGFETALWVYYHVAERQPRPILIGFHQREDRSFFELLLTVTAVGPTVAARSMNIPVCDYAGAIERRDLRVLGSLPGIGKRKAEQMIAALKGKVLQYALLPAPELAAVETPTPENFVGDVEAILRGMGHKPAEVVRMVDAARKRAPGTSDVQGLLEEIWRGEQGER